MSTSADTQNNPAPTAGRPADAGDHGYAKNLKNRHIQMIGIGGAIGTGLFLGAGGRLEKGGPSLLISYAICGVVAMIVVRALGEMVVHRPSSGAFVSYSREFIGEKAAYTAGWMHFIHWATTIVVDCTAIALYFHYWGFFSEHVPQWVIAAIALVVTVAINLVGVKLFGEMEFWFSIIKVTALLGFMALAIYFIVSGHHVGGSAPGLHNITDHGGFFPHGLAPMFMLMQGVIFAYSSMELVGVAAGEAENPLEVMPRAVNSVLWRIIVFYLGSLVLLTLLLPTDEYSSTTSPFVTALAQAGVPHAGDVMNVIVITAAASSMNSGLYSTGRVMRSMAVSGSAPRFLGVMSGRAVPAAGIIATAALGAVGVVINYLWPSEAFEIALNFVSVCIIAVWCLIMLSHLAFVVKSKRGGTPRPAFRLWASPASDIFALLFLVAVVVLLATSDNKGFLTVCVASPIVAIVLVIGWFFVRGKIDPDAFDAEEARLEGHEH